jgi:hypothetical protein
LLSGPPVKPFMPVYFCEPCLDDYEDSELKEPEGVEGGSDSFVTPSGWRESWFGSFPAPEISEGA